MKIYSTKPLMWSIIGMAIIAMYCTITDCHASNVDDTAIWDTANIPVCWENREPEDRHLMDIVRKAVADTWGQVTNLKFVGWDQCTILDSGVRIEIADTVPKAVFVGKPFDWYKQSNVYVNFEFNKWNANCPLIYTREACVMFTAVHEFGHVLGLSHEQDRHDTPVGCQGDPLGHKGTTTFTEWDLDSVMNYCNPHYDGFGVLSKMDIATAQAYYGNIPNFEASTRSLYISDVNGYTALLQDKNGTGQFVVLDVHATDIPSKHPQTMDGDVLTIPMGAYKDKGRIAALYSAKMQRISNGAWIFIEANRLPL